MTHRTVRLEEEKSGGLLGPCSSPVVPGTALGGLPTLRPRRWGHVSLTPWTHPSDAGPGKGPHPHCHGSEHFKMLILITVSMAWVKMFEQTPQRSEPDNEPITHIQSLLRLCHIPSVTLLSPTSLPTDFKGCFRIHVVSPYLL